MDFWGSATKLSDYFIAASPRQLFFYVSCTACAAVPLLVCPSSSYFLVEVRSQTQERAHTPILTPSTPEGGALDHQNVQCKTRMHAYKKRKVSTSR